MKNTELSHLNSTVYKWTLCTSLAIFLNIFINTFLPFGVSNYDPNHQYTTEFILGILSFTMVTFLVSVFNEFVIKRFVIRRLTVANLILWSIWSFIFYGLGNFLMYNFNGDWHDFSLASGIFFIANIFTILIFPMLGVMVFFHFKSLRKQFDSFVNQQKNKIDPTQLITFAGQGQTDSITLTVADFLFAKAQDNYIELHYLDGDTTSSHLLRTTVNNLESTLSVDFIVRCHRSFLVNLYHVGRYQGSTSDLKLSLNGIDEQIPVSKTYTSSILSKLRNYHKS